MLFCIVTFNLWLHFNKLLTYLLTSLLHALYLCYFLCDCTVPVHYHLSQHSIIFGLLFVRVCLGVLPLPWQADDTDVKKVQTVTKCFYTMFRKEHALLFSCITLGTRGQSNLTKSTSRGPIPRIWVTPGGRNLYH